MSGISHRYDPIEYKGVKITIVTHRDADVASPNFGKYVADFQFHEGEKAAGWEPIRGDDGKAILFDSDEAAREGAYEVATRRIDDHEAESRRGSTRLEEPPA